MRALLALLFVLAFGWALAQPVQYDSKGRAIEPKPKNSMADYRAKGVIYERINPITKASYVGQAWDWERFNSRIREHNRELQKTAGKGVHYEFRVLSRPFQAELSMAEAAWVRKKGGLQGLENKVSPVKDYAREAELRTRESARERFERREQKLERDARRISERRMREARSRNNADLGRVRRRK